MPAGVLAGTLVAQQLFDGGLQDGVIGLQPLEGRRILEQREQAVADQVGGRLLSADHGDDGIGDYFFVGKPVAIDLGGHQRVNEALARTAAEFVNRRPESIRSCRSTVRRMCAARFGLC